MLHELNGLISSAFCLIKKQQKIKKIYGEPSHRPLPDTAIFSGHRAFAAAQQFEPF